MVNTSGPRPIFAAVQGSHYKYLTRVNIWDWLISYWEFRNTRDPAEVIQCMRKGAPEDSHFMLDSGAFTAWNLGNRIALWDYIDFIHKYGHLFSSIVCLDVINNPVASEIHHLIMLEAGCTNVMPVFHSGEPLRVLEYLIDKGYKHIGLSPNNSWSSNVRTEWLLDLGRRFDFTGIRTHSFGYGSLKCMRKAPFITTYDTTTWIMLGSFGRIIVDVDNSIWGVSEDQNVPDNPIALCNAPSCVHDRILEVCNDIGFTMENLREHHSFRKGFNACVFSSIARNQQSVLPAIGGVGLWDNALEDYGFLDQSIQFDKLFTEQYMEEQANILFSTRKELDYKLEAPAKTGAARKRKDHTADEISATRVLDLFDISGAL